MNDENDCPVPQELLARLKKLFGRATLADCLKQGQALREARTHFPTTKGFIEWAKTELGLSTSWAAKLVQLAKNWNRIQDAAANLGLDVTMLTVGEAIDLAPSKPRKPKEKVQEAAPKSPKASGGKGKGSDTPSLEGGSGAEVLAIGSGSGGGGDMLAPTDSSDPDEPADVVTVEVKTPSPTLLARAVVEHLEAAIEVAVQHVLHRHGITEVVTTDIELLGGRGVHSIALDTAVKVLIDMDLFKGSLT